MDDLYISVAGWALNRQVTPGDSHLCVGFSPVCVITLSLLMCALFVPSEKNFMNQRERDSAERGCT